MVTNKASIALYLNAASAKVMCARTVAPARRTKAHALRKSEALITRSRGLDQGGLDAIFREMLQHNSAKAGKQAHIAHAAMMGLHALCCGLPAMAMLAAAASGATSGLTLLSDSVAEIHAFLHGHEIWILVVSAALVVTGGWLELTSRRHERRGFPWLFAFSALCFVFNVAIIALHRA